MSEKVQDLAQFKLRIKHKRMDWLKKRAERNNRTVNAEINFILGYFEMLEENGSVPKSA